MHLPILIYFERLLEEHLIRVTSLGAAAGLAQLILPVDVDRSFGLELYLGTGVAVTAGGSGRSLKLILIEVRAAFFL